MASASAGNTSTRAGTEPSICLNSRSRNDPPHPRGNGNFEPERLFAGHSFELKYGAEPPVTVVVGETDAETALAIKTQLETIIGVSVTVEPLMVPSHFSIDFTSTASPELLVLTDIDSGVAADEYVGKTYQTVSFSGSATAASYSSTSWFNDNTGVGRLYYGSEFISVNSTMDAAAVAAAGQPQRHA